MNELFRKLKNYYNFSGKQAEQYEKFIFFLQEENKKYNLTNIFELTDILLYHVVDTLEITKTNLLDGKNSIADIGSGCGIPGIILSIFYPEKKFVLIEVNNKKIHFLNQAIGLLGLENCVVSEYDFRTFAVKHKEKIETFVARASLPLSEMIYIYDKNNKNKVFRKSNIIYWGSRFWKTDPKHNTILSNSMLLISEIPYEIKNGDTDSIRKLNYVSIIPK